MSEKEKDKVSVEGYTASYCKNIVAQEVSSGRLAIKELQKSYDKMQFENAKEDETITNELVVSIKTLETYITDLENLEFEGDE